MKSAGLPRENADHGDMLPLLKTIEPTDLQELAQAVRECCATATPIYPLGGETSLDYGLPAQRPGMGLSIRQCDRVIDYPARDMTITVEAGITMQSLSETLARERQQLPIDVPRADRATVGGVVATNCNGYRRYGQGTVRDYVIGISAVDGRGQPFRGGGRVVKNVAGYDFCKLLTGSLGTLGVITQVTLRLKPIPERSLLMACRVPDAVEAEKRLEALSRSATAPAAIEWLQGKFWEQRTELGDALGVLDAAASYLVVALEGTDTEVRWMVGQLETEWHGLGVQQLVTLDERAPQLWKQLVEFPQSAPSPLVIKASLRPAGVVPFAQAVRRVDPECHVQAHAGSGIVLVRFDSAPIDGLARAARMAAETFQGHVVVLSAAADAARNSRDDWCSADAPYDLMTLVKRQFDPQNLLNPGRFVYQP